MLIISKSCSLFKMLLHELYLIKRTFDRTPVSPLFKNIHWLKIKERIIFKICLIVHNCIWNTAPEALKEMMILTYPRTFKLEEKRISSGPKIWNHLPQFMRSVSDTKSFKTKLKTFLMTTELVNFYALLGWLLHVFIMFTVVHASSIYFGRSSFCG